MTVAVITSQSKQKLQDCTTGLKIFLNKFCFWHSKNVFLQHESKLCSFHPVLCLSTPPLRNNACSRFVRKVVPVCYCLSDMPNIETKQRPRSCFTCDKSHCLRYVYPFHLILQIQVISIVPAFCQKCLYCKFIKRQTDFTHRFAYLTDAILKP